MFPRFAIILANHADCAFEAGDSVELSPRAVLFWMSCFAKLYVALKAHTLERDEAEEMLASWEMEGLDTVSQAVIAYCDREFEIMFSEAGELKAGFEKTEKAFLEWNERPMEEWTDDDDWDSGITDDQVSMRFAFDVQMRHAFLDIPIESREKSVRDNLIARLCAQQSIAYVRTSKTEDGWVARLVYDEAPENLLAPGEWQEYDGPTEELALALALYGYCALMECLPDGYWGHLEEWWVQDGEIEAQDCASCGGAARSRREYMSLTLGGRETRVVRKAVTCPECEMKDWEMVEVGYVDT
jgi:hypothetical protein